MRAGRWLLGCGLLCVASVGSAALVPALIQGISEMVARTATPAPLPAPTRPPQPWRDPFPWRDLVPAGDAFPIESVFTHASQRDPGRQALLGSVGKLFQATPRLIRTTADGKHFGASFRAGATEGERRLHRATGALATLTRPWLNAPQSKRVFVVGVARGDADARRLRRRLVADGYQVFFYRFCEPVVGALCSGEDVGAFFGSAGHVIAFTAPGQRDSTYVKVELASIYKHTAGGLLLVFTPQELVRGGRSASVALLTAAAYDVDRSDRRKSAPRAV